MICSSTPGKHREGHNSLPISTGGSSSWYSGHPHVSKEIDSPGSICPTWYGKVKSVVTTTKNLVKVALQARQADITREAQWVIRNRPITFHFVHF